MIRDTILTFVPSQKYN